MYNLEIIPAMTRNCCTFLRYCKPTIHYFAFSLMLTQHYVKLRLVTVAISIFQKLKREINCVNDLILINLTLTYYCVSENLHDVFCRKVCP